MSLAGQTTDEVAGLAGRGRHSRCLLKEEKGLGGGREEWKAKRGERANWRKLSEGLAQQVEDLPREVAASSPPRAAS